MMMNMPKSELLNPCPRCEGQGRHPVPGKPGQRVCEHCDEVGFLDVPSGPCPFDPGTPEKVIWLAARYRRSEPLHRDEDHGVESQRQIMLDAFLIDC
jgi:hypothetical protein